MTDTSRNISRICNTKIHLYKDHSLTHIHSLTHSLMHMLMNMAVKITYLYIKMESYVS